MVSEGIISNPLSQEIREKGHQSIRFTPDGFSLLVSDAGYRPVILSQYTFDPSVPFKLVINECGRILEELNLLDFEGETVLILDAQAATLVPEPFFDEVTARNLLEKTVPVNASERVVNRPVRQRQFRILFAYPAELDELTGRIHGMVRILHSSECLLSLSDQVQASDHQRGFILAEVQQLSLGLLLIKEDGIKLLNRYALREPSEFIYHTLNVVKQLELDRENTPVYLSGIVHPEHELYGLLGKYMRRVKITPYYLEELPKEQVMRFMILSEGSKCA